MQLIVGNISTVGEEVNEPLASETAQKGCVMSAAVTVPAVRGYSGGAVNRAWLFVDCDTACQLLAGYAACCDDVIHTHTGSFQLPGSALHASCWLEMQPAVLFHTHAGSLQLPGSALHASCLLDLQLDVMCHTHVQGHCNCLFQHCMRQPG